jgi:hypothetical protein
MTEQKTYTLSDAERRHVAEVRAQLSESEAECLKLKGAIWDKQNEMSFMRRHLSVFLGNVATNAGLPIGSTLSADGASLIGRD